MASDDSEGGKLSEHLNLAEAHFERAIEVFQATIEKIRLSDDISLGEADMASRALFNAVHTVLNFKVRIYDERKRQEGAHGQYSLDLEEARDKVGRLLDRIRADRGTE